MPIDRFPAPSSSTCLAVRAHQSGVSRGDAPCGKKRCPRCGIARAGNAFFRRHGFRDRGLLTISDRLIRRVRLRLIRWRCPLCRKTFTDHPPFMLPGKQYALPDMKARVLRCVSGAGASFRRGVRDSNLPIFHASPRGEGSASGKAPEEAEEGTACPVLSHTTPYRWVASLGMASPTSQRRRSATRYKGPGKAAAGAARRKRKPQGEANDGRMVEDAG